MGRNFNLPCGCDESEIDTADEVYEELRESRRERRQMEYEDRLREEHLRIKHARVGANE